jgi:glycosyltransferase involved in cell wall biosynthesis
MRVLHVQKVHGMGGSERHLLDLVPRLRQRGIDATFCALVEPGAEEFVARLGDAGVPTRTVPAGRDVNPWLAIRLARVVRAERPDVVHTHLVHADTYGLVGATAARTRSVRSVHNTVPELARQPYRAASRLSGRLARRTIAISQHARRYVLDHRMAPPDRVRVVRYGIDVERWGADEAARRAARAGLAVAPDDVVIGVASRMVAHKGHDVLLNAFARACRQAPHLRLVVAGDGALRPQLEARARPLGDTVRFVGHLDPGRIEPFMHACDVLSFPSLATFGEGFGLAALEASAAGRPVLASDVASLPEIVVDGETGVLVPGGDVTALAAALVALAEDPDSRTRMGEAGRARARDEFSIATMVDETIAVYEEAARA